MSQARGAAAEDSAADYLKTQGLRLLDRNVKSRHGELDLVMQHGATLVFVEVRARAATRFASAIESIGAAKRQRLLLAAQQYLTRYRSPPPCRFDVVTFDGRLAAPVWLQDAFSAD